MSRERLCRSVVVVVVVVMTLLWIRSMLAFVEYSDINPLVPISDLYSPLTPCSVSFAYDRFSKSSSHFKSLFKRCELSTTRDAVPTTIYRTIMLRSLVLRNKNSNPSLSVFTALGYILLPVDQVNLTGGKILY